METVKKRDLVILILTLAALVAFSPMAMAAGSLEPSAPPGPVMKSLDEVEPRVPIKASDLPLTITQRGSYYLTQDVNFTDTAHHAITVGCNDVTIDLKGYSITGPNSTSYSGIYMDGHTNVEVRNGTVRDFHNGISEDSFNGRGHRVINIRAVSNTIGGIYLVSRGDLVKDCTAVENTNGIYAGYGCTVTGNTASKNGYNGIHAQRGCTVTGNTASNNGNNGIDAQDGCTVTGNTASDNTRDGIGINSYCNVIGNDCYANGNGGDGAGIHANSNNNRIEGNHVSANDRGIDVDSGNNLIVKNSAVVNTTEYDIVGGNKVGTISSDPTTAGPWDNFDL
jgi:parallel beta-helix repeat protein